MTETTPRTLEIAGVHITRANFFKWVNTFDDEDPRVHGDGTRGLIVQYVARGVAKHRREEVVTLRLDHWSRSGQDERGNDIIDGWTYQLTTGDWNPAANAYNVDYPSKWFTITAGEVALVDQWLAEGSSRG